jgi:hypothetical protein
LKFESSDEPSLDYRVYDGHSIDDIPAYRDVESPLKDMFVPVFSPASCFQYSNPCDAVWDTGMAISTQVEAAEKPKARTP